MTKWHYSLGIAGVALVVISFLHMYLVWDKQSRLLETYPLMLAGRVTVSKTRMAEILDSRMAMTRARMLGSTGAVLGLCAIAVGSLPVLSRKRTLTLEIAPTPESPKPPTPYRLPDTTASSSQHLDQSASIPIYAELRVDRRPLTQVEAFWAPESWNLRLRWFGLLPSIVLVIIVGEVIGLGIFTVLGDTPFGRVSSAAWTGAEGALSVVVATEMAPAHRRIVSWLAVAVTTGAILLSLALGWIPYSQTFHWSLFIATAIMTAWKM